MLKIRNPDYVDSFSTFRISVLDKEKEVIAQTDQPITYKTTPGSFSDVKLYPENNLVDSESRLTLEFKPNHKVAADGKLRVEIAKDLTVKCPTNFDYNSPMLKKPLEVKCSENGDFFVIEASNAFVRDYSFLQDSDPIKMVFLDTKMPPSQREIKGLRISTINAAGKTIDYFDNEKMEKRTLFEAVKAPFFGTQVSVDTDRTYTDATFTFKLTLGNPMLPTASYIEIILPKEVAVSEESLKSGLVVTSVRNVGAGATASAPTTLPDKSTSIKVSNIFAASSSAFAAGVTLEFSLSKLRTPLTTKSSESFRVYSRDAADRIINFVETDLLVTMPKGKLLDGLTVTSSSYVVGKIAEHSIQFTSPVPISSTDSIFVMYPD